MKKTTFGVTAAAFAMLFAAGPAQAASCLWVHNINDFKPAKDEKSLILTDSPSRKYNVSLVGRCVDLRFAETISVRSVGDQFCLEAGDFISFGSSGISRRCMISKIEPIAPPPADSGQ